MGIKLLNAITGANVVLHRFSGGRLGGKVSGAPVLLLDHIGRKSGRRRTTPVLYIQDGNDSIVVASRAGSDFDPAWWLKPQGEPGDPVQVRSQRRQVVARQATPEEKERLRPRLVDAYPGYAAYQRRTEREIPVIVLSPL